MNGVITSFLTTPARADRFFDYKKLDAAGVARLEGVVASARETLALADRLQVMRDTTSALWRLEDRLKATGGFGNAFIKRIDLSV